MNGMALCAGIGGLELGLKIALPQYRCICYIEREAYPATILATRMAEGWMDEAPIWDNLETFEGRPWRGIVDIISAGFPCQPWSTAGQRAGVEDKRWIWPEIQRIIRQVEPRIIFLENVPGLLNGGAHTIFRDLAELGFNAEWGVFSAQGSGAPHIRRRLFILAYSNSRGWPAEFTDLSGGESNPDRRDCGSDASHSDRQGIWPLEIPVPGGRNTPLPEFDGSVGDVANAKKLSQRKSTNNSKPLPGEWGAWKKPSGGGWWATEPGLGRVVDGAPHRLDRLCAIGNAVVPSVAARAFLTLSRRAHYRPQGESNGKNK